MNTLVMGDKPVVACPQGQHHRGMWHSPSSQSSSRWSSLWWPSWHVLVPCHAQLTAQLPLLPASAPLPHQNYHGGSAGEKGANGSSLGTPHHSCPCVRASPCPGQGRALGALGITGEHCPLPAPRGPVSPGCHSAPLQLPHTALG